MRALILTLLLAVACGGGGDRVSGIVTPAGMLRTDLLFGYYGSNAATATETADHANLYFAADFYGPLEQLAGVTHAKGNGQRVILMLPAYSLDDAGIRLWLDRLANVGLLSSVVALYPIDEPDIIRSGNRSDAEVTAMNARLRAIAAEYPDLRDVKLAVIYSGGSGRRPGIASYDWIGIDDYGAGCGALRHYDALSLRPDQRTMLVPGGADPWRQDPACFESRAHRDQQVAAIITFIWQSVTDAGAAYRGVRENGLRQLYCEAGRKIMRPAEEPRC